LVKTQITQNRTIIYIMNLWAKRVAGSLVVAAAVLFVSCLDEDNIAGFRNENRKFKTSFIEIPLESSVILFDSLRTSNYISDPIRRMLVGKFTDPAFGQVYAEAYTQYLPISTSKAKEADAVFDSVSFIINFDYYHFGAATETVEQFKIHRLTEDLTFRGSNDYYNFSSVNYDPTPIGEGELSISPESFDTLINFSSADTIVTLEIKLADDFGLDLFNNWDASSPDFKDFRIFTKLFKGIAIVPGTNNQQALGLSVGTNTKVRLHYHTPTDTLFFDYPVTSGINTSHYQYDRSGSGVSGLTNKYIDFIPPNPNKRYIQNGGLISTKFDIDLSKFFEFADTIENLVINSAEISIDEIDDPSDFPVPQSLFVQVLKDNNRLKQFASTDKPQQRVQDSIDLILYANNGLTLTNGLQGLSTSTISIGSVFSPMADTQRDLGRLTYVEDDERYLGYFTLFFQELARREFNADGVEKTRFKKFILYPSDPYAAKSFNRVVFNKQALKLRIYYTQPTIN